MQIPDEVLHEARLAFYHHHPVLTNLGLEDHAQVIAEWARKEALKDVCEWLTSDLELRDGMDTYTMTSDYTLPEVVLEFIRDELKGAL